MLSATWLPGICWAPLRCSDVLSLHIAVLMTGCVLTMRHWWHWGQWRTSLWSLRVLQSVSSTMLESSSRHQRYASNVHWCISALRLQTILTDFNFFSLLFFCFSPFLFLCSSVLLFFPSTRQTSFSLDTLWRNAPFALDNADDNDPDADWFCWQCECIDDCLGMVNEQSETDTRAWEDLFPELRSTAETGLLGKLKKKWI